MRVRVFLAIVGLACAAGRVTIAQGRGESAIDVQSAWLREADAGQASTSAYFVLRNRSPAPVRLVGVSSPIAASAEIHVMQMTGGPDSIGHAGGMMTMRQIPDVVVPAQGSIEFKPGGYHVMLFKIARAVTTGSAVALTLRFSDGTTRTVQAAVGSRAAISAPAPGGPDR